MGRAEDGNGQHDITDKREQESFLKGEMRRAHGLDIRYRITRRLGLEKKPEKKLARYYLAHNIRRYRVYKGNYFANNAMVYKFSKLPVLDGIIGSMLEKHEQKSKELEVLKETIEQYTQEHFLDGNGFANERASAIERAMNMLVFDFRTENGGARHFRPSRGLLRPWAEEWRPVLSSN